MTIKNWTETCILLCKKWIASLCSIQDTGCLGLGWPREMLWGERWEGGSGLGTHVHPWRIHVKWIFLMFVTFTCLKLLKLKSILKKSLRILEYFIYNKDPFKNKLFIYIKKCILYFWSSKVLPEFLFPFSLRNLF